MIKDLIYVLSFFTKRTKGEKICIVKQESTPAELTDRGFQV